jgi:hypothetical protein
VNGFGTFIDTDVILSATSGASRDQAMKVRDALRYLLRAVEDIHQLPHSFQTQAEKSQREIDEQRRQRT